jgi:hypothetical protein
LQQDGPVFEDAQQTGGCTFCSASLISFSIAARKSSILITEIILPAYLRGTPLCVLGEPLIVLGDPKHHRSHCRVGELLCDVARLFGALAPMLGLVEDGAARLAHDSAPASASRPASMICAG